MERLLPLIPIVCLLLLIASCGQIRYIPSIERHAKVQEVTHHRIDSIHLIDSIYVHTHRDTVYQTRWRTLLRERKLIDTVYIFSTDSTAYPAVVELPHRATLSERIEAWAWRIVGGFALVYLFLQVIVRLWRK